MSGKSPPPTPRRDNTTACEFHALDCKQHLNQTFTVIPNQPVIKRERERGHLQSSAQVQFEKRESICLSGALSLELDDVFV